MRGHGQIPSASPPATPPDAPAVFGCEHLAGWPDPSRPGGPCMWTRGCTRALASVAVALAAIALSAAGVARAAPAATTTRYMTTTDRDALYQEGCAQTDESGIVILDFGQPWWDGTSFGTILFGANTFRSVAEIE